MTKLSTATAMELKPTEILRDSGKKAQPGLYAIGRKSGARWVYHSELRQNGKRRGVKVTLGKAPAMDLTTARIEAAKAAQKIEKGVNPNEKTIEIAAYSARELTESLAAGINLAVPRDSKVTLAYVLERHLKLNQLAEATVYDYRRHLVNQQFDTLYELHDVHVRDITPSRVAAIRDRLIERGPTMTANTLRTLKALMTTAQQIDFGLLRNPVKVVKIPSVKKKTLTKIRLDEFAEHIGTLSKQQRLMWLFLLCTGVRHKTLKEQLRGDIDTDTATVFLTHLKKPDADRPLPLGTRLNAMMVDWLEQPHLGSYLFGGRTGGKFGCLRKGAGPHSPHELRKIYSATCTEAGVPFEEKELLLCHRLPGASENYSVHHLLADVLRPHQQKVEDLLQEKCPKLFK